MSKKVLLWLFVSVLLANLQLNRAESKYVKKLPFHRTSECIDRGVRRNLPLERTLVEKNNLYDAKIVLEEQSNDFRRNPENSKVNGLNRNTDLDSPKLYVYNAEYIQKLNNRFRRGEVSRYLSERRNLKTLTQEVKNVQLKTKQERILCRSHGNENIRDQKNTITTIAQSNGRIGRKNDLIYKQDREVFSMARDQYRKPRTKRSNYKIKTHGYITKLEHSVNFNDEIAKIYSLHGQYKTTSSTIFSNIPQIETIFQNGIIVLLLLKTIGSGFIKSVTFQTYKI